MQLNKWIIWVLCVLLWLGGAESMLAYSYDSGYQSWGSNSYVSSYYYGERQAFQQNDNMFTYGATATWDMQTTSTQAYTAATFSTAAGNITAGVTLADYNAECIRKALARMGNGRDDHSWETDDAAPIGDGWDVLLFLLLAAAGYGVVIYRKNRLVNS